MRCPVLLRVLVIAALLAVDGRGLPQLVSDRALADGNVSSSIVFVTADREAAGCCGTAACCCCRAEAVPPVKDTQHLACGEQDASLSGQVHDTFDDARNGCGCSARQRPDAPRIPMAPSPAGHLETSVDLLSVSNAISLLCADVAEAPCSAATSVSFPSPLQRQLARFCCWRT